MPSDAASFLRSLTLCLAAMALPPALHAQDKAPATEPAALDFEAEGMWQSIPLDFADSDWKDLEDYNNNLARRGLTDRQVKREDLTGGAKLSDKHVKKGKYALEWRDHPKYPTIAARVTNPDWSPVRGLRFQVYSEAATGEVVTLGLQSDNPATHELDYLVYSFPVDWTGWKEITVPYTAFTKLGNPQGWQKIDGIYFFTKAGFHSPNPQTALYLDALELFDSAEGLTATWPAPPDPNAGSDIRYEVAYSVDAPQPLNHAGPEVAPGASNKAPFLQDPYFRNTRANQGYFPAYDPGFVSFDPQGNAYIRSPGVIETLGPDGKWQKIDLSGALKDYARQRGWKGVAVGWSGDPVVRFDNDGDMYALENLKNIDAQGKEVTPKDRIGVLLHSRDKGKTWKTYTLPGQMVDFEKMDGHNQDALKHPPVITASGYGYFPWADTGGYLVLPEKNEDGTLTIPPALKIDPYALLGPLHSGSGNFVLTQGDKIFIVYGTLPRKGEEEKWKQGMPPIPADHPARQMSYISHMKGNPKVSATDGTPSFIRVYDRKTKQLSEPVFLGYGGRHLDGHNWPAISADSQGILHVIINGHIDPMVYTHSLKPGDISAWSPPIYVPHAPGAKDDSHVSYGSLTCDKHDNLYTFVRSDTRAYNHRLAMQRKPAGQPWDAEQDIVVPFRGGYHVWSHKVAYNPLSDRLYVGLYERGNMEQMSAADYKFYRFQMPQVEASMVDGLTTRKDGLNKGMPEGKKTTLFMKGPADAVVLVSEDQGQAWRLATTPDFLPKKAEDKPAGEAPQTEAATTANAN